MQNINLTEQEVTLLFEIQQEEQQINFNFGNLEIAQLELLERKEKLKLQYTAYKKKEASLLEALTEKYGVGTINLETKQFIPNN